MLNFVDYGLFVRTELCPEMAAKSTYEMWSTRYDNKTKVCYKTGTKGPCGNNMIFYAVSDDPVYGECDCKANSNLSNTGVNVHACKMKYKCIYMSYYLLGNYEICRSMIYSREYDECFEAFQQGNTTTIRDLQSKHTCISLVSSPSLSLTFSHV